MIDYSKLNSSCEMLNRHLTDQAPCFTGSSFIIHHLIHHSSFIIQFIIHHSIHHSSFIIHH